MKSNKVLSLEIPDGNLENNLKTKEVVAIIGTGNYGIGLGKRLIHFGFEVAYGSRKLNRDYVSKCLDLDESEENLFTINTISDAFHKADKFVVFAVAGKEQIYQDIVQKLFETSRDTNKSLENSLKEKIVIEISNLEKKGKKKQMVKSKAEILQDLFDKYKDFGYNITVLKAFNTISAYTMSEVKQSQPIRPIPIVGNNFEAKVQLIRFSYQIGLQAYDFGTLKNALKLEEHNLELFPGWLGPSLFSIVYFIINSIWIFIYSPYVPRKPNLTYNEYLEGFSLLGHFSRVSGFCSLQLLAYVYLAGVIATIFQLCYGTKYKRFPKCLDLWLKSRKQLGLWAFYFGCFHVIVSILYTNPGSLGYMLTWYRKIPEYNITIYDNPYKVPILTYHAELSLLFGIVSFMLMLLLAITSINSIGSSLNWREWYFVQTILGYFSLLFGFGHDLSMYLSFVLDEEKIYNYNAIYILSRAMLYLLIVPFIVMSLKLIFSCFPPLKNRVRKIQNGTIV